MSWVISFFILLVIAVGGLFLGGRLMPMVMPSSGKWLAIIIGWVGGLVGSVIGEFTWQFGPLVGRVYPVAAIIGCILFLLLLGLFPFVKILVRKTQLR